MTSGLRSIGMKQVSPLLRATLQAAPAGLLRRHAPAAAAWVVVPRRKLSSVDVPIPELGAESIVEGGILSLVKKPGDFVAAEEMVAEIETGTNAQRGPFYLSRVLQRCVQTLWSSTVLLFPCPSHLGARPNVRTPNRHRCTRRQGDH